MSTKVSTRLLAILVTGLLTTAPASLLNASDTDDSTREGSRCARMGSGCCKGQGGGHGKGNGGGGKGRQHRHRGGGNGCCMGGSGEDMAEVRDVIHGLLDDRDAIQRQVKEVDGGVVTTTTSNDPVVAARIRLHVAQMEARLEEGRPMRQWDPLFKELFDHHEEIETVVEDVEGGSRVTQTSPNPEVTALIRQHASRAVSEFVQDGYERVHQETPLPEDATD